MGTDRKLTPAVSTAGVRRVVEAFDAVPQDLSARERIAALSAAIADAHDRPMPTAFADDVVSLAVRDSLRDLDLRELPLSILGSVWEQLIDDRGRQRRGAHFTPDGVARSISRLALDASDYGPDSAPPRVWDPACGGGSFLLAAAQLIEEQSDLSRRDIVTGLWGTDIDATALDVCSTTLELWSRSDAQPQTVAADALLELPDNWPTDFDLVVGNPPFLGQLAASTSRSTHRRAKLNERFRSAGGTYVDDAGLFVELATERVRPGGAIGFVLPESLLGSRDATPMRELVAERGEITDLWIGDTGTFAASVDVVAMVFRRGTDRQSTATTGATRVISVEDDAVIELGQSTTPSPATWAPLLAAAAAVPEVVLDGEELLSQHCEATAGFRQHFYGIADAVANGIPDDRSACLVTSGAIDPLRPLWGTRPVRFAKHPYESPVLKIDAIEDVDVRNWFQARRRPKILLASQTRVVEAIVDTEGTSVPSVPVISVEPHDPKVIWHIAAALSAPAVSAWLVRRNAGTGMSRNAIRLRAANIGQVPLPTDQDSWNVGANRAEEAQAASEAGDTERYKRALRAFAAAMNHAYGVPNEVSDWWWEQLRLPPG